ncbi:hypothetical protein H8959_019084 [Pygathrix nigripes]
MLRFEEENVVGRALTKEARKAANFAVLQDYCWRDCSGNPGPNFGDITTVTFPVTPNTLPNYQTSSTSALSNGFYHFGSTSSGPPVSPASSDLLVAGSRPDTFNDVSPSFGLHPSPVHVCMEESHEQPEWGPCSF